MEGKDIRVVLGHDLSRTLGVSPIQAQLWNELYSASREASLAPTSEMWSFADSCLLFGAIVPNDPPATDIARPSASIAWRLQASRAPRWGSPPARNIDLPVADAFLPSFPDDVPTRPSTPEMAMDNGEVKEEAELDAWKWTDQAEEAIRKPPPQPAPTAVGIVFLTTSQRSSAPAGDGNIGIVLDASARGKGYACQAIEIVLNWAFNELGFHRVQAAILQSPGQAKALNLFAKMYVAFRHLESDATNH